VTDSELQDGNTKDENLRIIDIELDNQAKVRWNPDIQQEIDVSIFDLKEENFFAPQDLLQNQDGKRYPGPFFLNLSVSENRLVMEIQHPESRENLDKVLLALSPFRRIIRDYFAVCESYYEAIKTASPAQIEAIDMGRRGLHNEGSELLRERLDGKVAIDFDTARRLFTLLCVLQIR